MLPAQPKCSDAHLTCNAFSHPHTGSPGKDINPSRRGGRDHPVSQIWKVTASKLKLTSAELPRKPSRQMISWDTSLWKVREGRRREGVGVFAPVSDHRSLPHCLSQAKHLSYPRIKLQDPSKPGLLVNTIHGTLTFPMTTWRHDANLTTIMKTI